MPNANPSKHEMTAAVNRVARVMSSGALDVKLVKRPKVYSPLGEAMFNRDALFGKKDEPAHNEHRTEPRSVNITPALTPTPATRPQPESSKTDLRFAESPRGAARSEEPKGSRLIVGPDIKLKGVEISNCDTLVVEGRVEASMNSRVVEIAENGVFSGTVNIDVAEIRGRFEGELTARKQLVIYSTGSVSGHIRYGKIRIEEGGELAGDVSQLGAVVEHAQTAAQTESAATPLATLEEVAEPAQPATVSAQKPQAPRQQNAQSSTAPQKQPTFAAASSADRLRYEAMNRAGKNGKGANIS